MAKYPFIFFVALCAFSIEADEIKWVAVSLNNSLDDPINWSTNSVPGSLDIAIFDSSLRNVVKDPEESNTLFNVQELRFPYQAAPFTFTFSNQSLQLSGLGITGAKRNPNITIINTDNLLPLLDLCAFTGLESSIGNSKLLIKNRSILNGSYSNTIIGLIDTNLYSLAAHTVGKGASIEIENFHTNNSSGTLANNVGKINFYQFGVDNYLTIEDDVQLNIINGAEFSGVNTAFLNRTSSIGTSQFFSLQALDVGNSFNAEIVNVGFDSSSGYGGNYVADINGPQFNLLSTATFGNDAKILLANLALSGADTTNLGNYVGYLNDYQFYVREALQAGDGFELEVINYGEDNSTGFGVNALASINSNSGNTGYQVQLLQGANLGKNSSIRVLNSGNCSAQKSSGSSQAAGMNASQFCAGSPFASGFYNFSDEEGFSLNVLNSGDNDVLGQGGDAVGTVSSYQAAFFTFLSIGNDSLINITNLADYRGEGSASYSNVGSVGTDQLYAAAAFEAKDRCSFFISNQAECSATGYGGNFVGHIGYGKQAHFGQNLQLGKNNTFNISNSANNSASTVNYNNVGNLFNQGSQFCIAGSLIAEDDLSITVMNSGFANSSNTLGGYTAIILNNTGGFLASQLHVNQETLLGNHTYIQVSNNGTTQANLGANATTSLQRTQVAFVGNVTMKDATYIDVTNIGTLSTETQNNNTVSVILDNSGQMYFGGNCSLGKNNYINIANSGENQNILGLDNLVAYVTGSQMEVNGILSAQENFNLRISNDAISSAEDGSNLTGHILGSQLKFHQNCLFGDGTDIFATNTGTVIADSIYFLDGFSVVSGRARIAQSNQGTLGSYGIHIEGNTNGGNAEIALTNSSLYIETTLSDYTIGGLTSDPASIVQSLPHLIINVDENIENSFNGTILDFSEEMITEVTKKGEGTQIFGGVNIYTGLTTVEEGTLVVNGSIAHDVLVESSGVLKGSGTIFGILTNQGQIAPGQSIGITTLTDFVNDGGDYEAEVNSLGQSDLIYVTNSAFINGGRVLVSTVDHGFNFYSPYTILTSEGTLEGAFSSASSTFLIKPMLDYDANHIYLTIYSDLMKVATSCNQKGVAYNLDNLRNLSSDQAKIISEIASMSTHDAKNALESLSRFQYTNETWSTQIAVNRFIRRLYDPLREYVTNCETVTSNPWNGWIEGGVNFSEITGSNAHTSHLTSYNLTLGLQKELIKNFFFGLAGSYEYEYQNFRDATANLNAGYAGLYTLYRPENFYALMDLAYGYAQADVNRTILPKSLGYNASGKATTQSGAFYTEVGYDFNVSYCLIQPFLGAQVAYNYRDPIHENHQDQFGLKLRRFDWTSASSRLGLHASVCNIVDFFDGSLDLAWDQMYTSSKNSTKGQFYDFGESFCVCGNKIDKTSIDYALTISKNVANCVNGYVQFEGQWSQHALTNGFILGVDGSF